MDAAPSAGQGRAGRSGWGNLFLRDVNGNALPRPTRRCPQRLSLIVLSQNEDWEDALAAVALAAPTLQALELNWQAPVEAGESRAEGRCG